MQAAQQLSTVHSAKTVTLQLSPQGRLLVEHAPEGSPLAAAFRESTGRGLLYLDTAPPALAADPVLRYWKDFTREYLSRFMVQPDLESRNLAHAPITIALTEADTARFLLTAPVMKGAEYLNAFLLQVIWQKLEAELHLAILAEGKGIEAYFAARHAGWGLLGKVCFHLAENKKSEATPFAFLATYAHRMAGDGEARHLPLNRALQEYAEKSPQLLRLLAPIHRATQASEFLKQLVDTGEVYHPQAWTARQAHRFLTEVPLFEQAGIAVKIPNWWKKQAARPEITITLGDKPPSMVGASALLDFKASLQVGDAAISEAELRELLTRSENLIFFKGQWVEVDRDRLTALLNQWKSVERQVHEGSISFADGMRLMAGMQSTTEEVTEITEQNRVICGPWLEKTLAELRSPATDKALEDALKTQVKATLRPYQHQGVAWLHLLHRLHLGAILADDMGLGKTLQVISLLAVKKAQTQQPLNTLLIVPASLIGNWKAEVARFAPGLSLRIVHPSGEGLEEPETFSDITLTTYGMAQRLDWLAAHEWDLLVLDEAQAIKNPGTKQTRAIKSLKAAHRLAMTGTPVENKLGDLWSLFDCVSPELLGSAKAFESFMKHTDDQGRPRYAALRSLTRPYILRRLKTDKTIIADLPDKTEMKRYCQLSKTQTALYQQAIEKLAHDLDAMDGTDDIARKGLIVSTLMRLKQICNHPSHWLKESQFKPEESGKFQELHAICETIEQKQEKLLVFTQFKEMTAPLAAFLSTIFGRPGLVLHGGTPVKQRTEMVEEFQRDDGPPFFVLSLKAGGTGLNLTAASHVIHFDRWWNPAVENQATDRAFRIGQKRNVLVHQFICKGTLEEKIDAMLEAKRALSTEVMEDGSAAILTALSNKELLQVVALDLRAARQ